MILPFFSLSFITKLIYFLEEKPLSQLTLTKLENLKPSIDYYSTKYCIPRKVLAAAIGSEINRRIYIGKIIDQFQDYLFNSTLITEDLMLTQLESNIESKYLNLSKHDIGLGNINYETAVSILKDNPTELSFINNHKDLISYLLTEKGNIHLASLYIKKGQHLLSKYYSESNETIQNAILYSFYKQGESYYIRYLNNSGGKRAPVPGEGIEILKKLNKTLYKID